MSFGSSSGPLYGVLGLAATSAVVLFPATQIKALYGVTVGYGASIAAMGAMLRYGGDILGVNKLLLPTQTLQHSPASEVLANSLTAALICYGTRLSLFLWLREALQWRPRAHNKLDEMPRWKRIPFAMSLCLFYACLATPVLMVVVAKNENNNDNDKGNAKSTGTTGTARLVVETVGVALTWGGILIEAIADGHKSWVKSESRPNNADNNNNNNNNSYKDDEFVGPTGGLYAIVRHPNYLGEVTVYTGLLIAAIPSLGTSLTGWICSAVGWGGIVNLMRGSAQRLVNKQIERYGGQATFQAWVHRVPYPWIPFVKDVPTTTTTTTPTTGDNQKTD